MARCDKVGHSHGNGRRARETPPVVYWLRAGAVAAGLGAAVAVGAGVASADSGNSDKPSAPSQSAAPGTAKPSVGAARAASPRRSTGNVERTPSAAAATASPTQAVSAARSAAPHVRTGTGKSGRVAAPAASAGVTALAVTQASASAPAPAPTEPLYPEALSSPVTWESMSVDARRWLGLPPLPKSPFQFRPLPRPISDAWIALRRIEYRFFNDYPTGSPTQSPSDSLSGLVVGKLNSVDPDGDQIGYTVVDQPSRGAVVINADGSYTYTPSRELAHAGGTDTFSVVVGDTPGNPWHVHGLADLLGLTNPNTVAVTVKVNPIENRAPEVSASVVGPDPDQNGVVTGRISVSDRNGDPVSFSVDKNPGKGTVTIAPDGTYTYTPDAEKSHAASSDSATPADKADSFVVAVIDGYGGVSSTTVNVVVKPVNAAPQLTPKVTVFDTPTVLISNSDDGQGVRITTYSTTQILLIDPNAGDSDRDVLQVSATNADPEKGSIYRRADGTYLYVPTARTVKTVGSPSTVSDVVTVTATDGHGGQVSVNQPVTISNLLRVEGTLAPIVISGVGTTYIDPSGATRNVADGLRIDGTPLTVGIDAAGENLVVDGGEVAKNAVVLVRNPNGKPLPWSIETTTKKSDNTVQTVGVYTKKDPISESSLMVFFYLGN